MHNRQHQLQQIDRILTRQVALFRLSADARIRILSRLRSTRAKILGIVSSDLGTIKNKKQLNSLLNATDEIFKTEFAEMSGVMEELLTELSEKEMTFAASLLDIPPLARSKALKLARDVLILGAPSEDWWGKQSDNLNFSFASIVRQAIVDNLAVDQIVERVRPIFNTAERGIRALVNTSVASVSNSARLAVFDSSADDLESVQQISTLDGHTSDICIAYSGARWTLPDHKPIGDAPDFNNGPPRHFNCRSVLVPVTIFSDEPGQRVSELGLVDRNITFDEFLKMKTKDQQDEMLGEGKAQLWRDGVITLRDLLNQEGRPLTLQQLEKLHV